MQKLIVRNFGPIRELDLDIKDLSLFIGEQATGKSTVAKLIYFFKKVVKDELIGYLYVLKEVPYDTKFMQLRFDFFPRYSIKYFKLFGSSNHYFQLDFRYKEGIWLHVDNMNSTFKNFKVTFTQEWHDTMDADFNNGALWDSLFGILNQILDFREKYLTGERNFSDFEREEKRLAAIEQINAFFGEERDRNVIFIPAGRSLLTALSDRLPNKGWDYLMEKFRDLIADLKPIFYQSLQDIVSDKKQFGNNMPTAKTIDFALAKINEILKGEYRVDKEGEKLYFDENHHVKLSLASSGQQEVVWILLQLFVLILNKEKVFLVIEEPEAHLFPIAQKSLVELIALLFKENKSQVLITTHSPYILTAFNNLIYAGNVGEHHPEVSEIIPEMLWLNHEKVGAYRLSRGIKEDLMDEETNLIRVEEIDTVSQSINQDFDAILNLELQ